jgi:hypothetical protein
MNALERVWQCWYYLPPGVLGASAHKRTDENIMVRSAMLQQHRLMVARLMAEVRTLEVLNGYFSERSTALFFSRGGGEGLPDHIHVTT